MFNLDDLTVYQTEYMLWPNVPDAKHASRHAFQKGRPPNVQPRCSNLFNRFCHEKKSFQDRKMQIWPSEITGLQRMALLKKCLKGIQMSDAQPADQCWRWVFDSFCISPLGPVNQNLIPLIAINPPFSLVRFAARSFQVCRGVAAGRLRRVRRLLLAEWLGRATGAAVHGWEEDLVFKRIVLITKVWCKLMKVNGILLDIF